MAWMHNTLIPIGKTLRSHHLATVLLESPDVNVYVKKPDDLSDNPAVAVEIVSNGRTGFILLSTGPSLPIKPEVEHV